MLSTAAPGETHELGLELRPRHWGYDRSANLRIIVGEDRMTSDSTRNK